MGPSTFFVVKLGRSVSMTVNMSAADLVESAAVSFLKYGVVANGGVGVRLVPLLHQLLRVLVVWRIAVLPPGERRLRRSRPAEKQSGQTSQELRHEEPSHGSPSFDVLPVGSTKLHRDFANRISA